MKIEIQNCDEVIFHFNKAHLTNQDIPPWVLKTKGQTYYVKHVRCNAAWSTKETPDNSHTKGSLKVKKVDVIINEDGLCTLKQSEGGEY